MDDFYDACTSKYSKNLNNLEKDMVDEVEDDQYTIRFNPSTVREGE